jgi:Phosphodiester glycosidase
VLFAAEAAVYARAMLRPSSLPLSIRTVEWIRANGGAWMVNDVENAWYRWHAPKRGGPALRTLPAVGVAAAAPRHAARTRPVLVPHRIRPVITPPLRGEGRWRRTSWPIRGAPGVLVTVFRPQPAYPRLLAYAAWIDHADTRLALYPGRYEPPSGSPRGPMEVPWGERWRLLATFNSGFTYRDGHGGFVVDGHVYEPLQDGLGTLLAYRDGRVDVTTWRGGPDGSRGIVLARQNLPLIVDRRRPNPNLDNGPAWGATLGNAIQVWRSAVGVDRHGNLLYAAANYQTVGSLARLMIRIGAVRAIELDINAEWPSFIGYRRRGGRDPLKLVPNSMQSDTRYLSPDDRDFFAVYARPGGGAQVPFR